MTSELNGGLPAIDHVPDASGPKNNYHPEYVVRAGIAIGSTVGLPQIRYRFRDIGWRCCPRLVR